MADKKVFIAEEKDEGLRIDAWLNDADPSLSRSYIQKLIKSGDILVNDQPVKSSFRMRAGDVVSAAVPDSQDPEIMPEDIPLDILYEDSELLVVDKPKGMVVHPAAGHESGTLVNALLYHCRGSLSGINGVLRPGIVHRIDRDTTGLLVVCKTDRAHRSLAEQLADHSITRRYYTIVHGVFHGDDSDFHILPAERHLINCRWEDEEAFLQTRDGAHSDVDEQSSGFRADSFLCFRAEGRIGRHMTDRKKMTVTDAAHGKEAVTHVRILQSADGFSLAECRLETGRTHQIRVHMSHLGHPVLGDPVYGPKKCPVPGLEGQTLHAGILGFQHPVTGEYMKFRSSLPPYFNSLLKKFGFSYNYVV